MRRILLAAFAVVLLHAAPSMAAECTNLALASNGGVASANAQALANTVSLLNNGSRETGRDYRWFTRWTEPDWAQIEWRTPTRIDRIRLRDLVVTGFDIGRFETLRRTRVQYYDDATSSWVDVVGRSGQDNPILNWTAPTVIADGSEIKQFDFTPVTTSKIRVLFEQNSDLEYSYFDEIEAYDRGDCRLPPTECSDIALDGTASASSVHSSGDYPASGVNNGQVESGATRGYWNDNTNGSWPDWVQVAWDQPQTINRVVARIPLAQTGFPHGEITLRRTRIQYYDDATSSWVDVVGRTGQDNPILDWTGPIGTADGSETKTFDIAPVTTTKIRALIEDGATDGWSWLDELEAYSADCTPTPRDVDIALNAHGGTASAQSFYSNGWAPWVLNDGQREPISGYWLTTSGRAWAQIDWTSPRPLNRIVLRGPIFARDVVSYGHVLDSTRLQYWDDDAAIWVDVTGRSGQDNPILDWVLPLVVADGSEVKQFDFPTVATSRIRAVIEQGPQKFSFLDEIEAYWMS
jgi:hypothetical protein